MFRRHARVLASKAVVRPPIEIEKGAPAPSATNVMKATVAGVHQPFNPEEHFLLADLDMTKDAVLFGQDREVFFENVKKMKQVVITYHRWERSDNYYYYWTKLVQVGCVCALIDIIRNTHAKLTFRDSLDNFLEISQQDIEELAEKRQQAYTKLIKEFELNPPTFDRIRNKVVEPAIRNHPMDTLRKEESKVQSESDRVHEALESMGLDPHSQQLSYSSSPTTIPALKAARRILMPQVEDYTSIVKEEILEHRRHKSAQLQFPGKAVAAEQS